MKYIAFVKDPETKGFKTIESEYDRKSDFARDIKDNGYQLKYITTPENFERDSEKYHKRLEKARIYAKAKRETENVLKS